VISVLLLLVYHHMLITCRTGTNHNEDQPAHLKVRDMEKFAQKNLNVYDVSVKIVRRLKTINNNSITAT
jgi:hypothetical protein